MVEVNEFRLFASAVAISAAIETALELAATPGPPGQMRGARPMNESFRPPTAARRRIAARREAVRILMDEGHSARAISEIIGVSHDTAASDVRYLTPNVRYLTPKLIQESDETRLALLREEVREELQKDRARVARVAQMLNAALAALRPAEDGAPSQGRGVDAG
jgi:hypothetical protein